MRTRLSARVFLSAVTVLVLLVVLGILWISVASQPQSSTAIPSDLLAERHVGQTVKVTGVVVASQTKDGVLHLTLADPEKPDVGVLNLEYSGSLLGYWGPTNRLGKLSFDRGVTVLARGSLDSHGVFQAIEFLTK